MPKRQSMDGTQAMATKNFQQKTERSHEENQERAYIAASRRADRSIEARVQSARMASDIHKKRTGKGFKITEEIVMREEMYEEEEDDLPRQYRLLGAQLQTDCPELSGRLNAYLSANVAMRGLAHQNEINRRFAEQFPGAAQLTRQSISQPLYGLPLYPQHPPGPAPQSFPPVDSHASRHQQAQPIGAPADASPRRTAASESPGPMPRQPSVDAEVSPPSLSSGSDTPQTPVLQHSDAPFGTTSSCPVDPLLSTATPPDDYQLSQVVDVGWADPTVPSLYDHDGGLIGADSGSLELAGYGGGGVKRAMSPGADYTQPPQSSGGYFNTGQHIASQYVALPGHQSTIGTPGGGLGDSWDAWIDASGYASEEH